MAQAVSSDTTCTTCPTGLKQQQHKSWMTGTWELEKNEGTDEYLEKSENMSWLMRKAALVAGETHYILHDLERGLIRIRVSITGRSSFEYQTKTDGVTETQYVDPEKNTVRVTIKCGGTTGMGSSGDSGIASALGLTSDKNKDVVGNDCGNKLIENQHYLETKEDRVLIRELVNDRMVCTFSNPGKNLCMKRIFKKKSDEPGIQFSEPNLVK
jgi:hypothetical protein